MEQHCVVEYSRTVFDSGVVLDYDICAERLPEVSISEEFKFQFGILSVMVAEDDVNTPRRSSMLADLRKRCPRLSRLDSRFSKQLEAVAQLFPPIHVGGVVPPWWEQSVQKIRAVPPAQRSSPRGELPLSTTAHDLQGAENRLAALRQPLLEREETGGPVVGSVLSSSSQQRPPSGPLHNSRVVFHAALARFLHAFTTRTWSSSMLVAPEGARTSTTSCGAALTPTRTSPSSRKYGVDIYRPLGERPRRKNERPRKNDEPPVRDAVVLVEPKTFLRAEHVSHPYSSPRTKITRTKISRPFSSRPFLLSSHLPPTAHLTSPHFSHSPLTHPTSPPPPSLPILVRGLE